MARIFIVEDGPDIPQPWERALVKEGYSVEVYVSGREAMAAISQRPPDILVLDWMLPGMSGIDICQSVRNDPKTADVWVIMVSARGEESDRVTGLEIGADDYLTKPFSTKELVARVRRALLRRAQAQTPVAGITTYGPIAVDVERHIVTHGGGPVALTAKEFLLLQYLLTHRGRVLSRDALLRHVWELTYTGGTRTVDVHVRRLREKLPTLAAALVTVKQFGYKLLDEPPGSGD